MRRATFGPTPALGASIATMGVSGWIDQQLAPELLDDVKTENLVAKFPSVGMDPFELRDTYQDRREPIVSDLTSVRLIRAIYSERQLYETMVGFWTDHFNTDMSISPIMYLKGVDEREVIRPHALGRFSDMLLASAMSPAMLVYLNNASSRADGNNVPNENYARELLELHTVGVEGGYDEQDVAEVAHVLSGWTVDSDTAKMWFNPAWHSMESVKSVLGWKPNGLTGQAAGESLIEHLAHLPQTAKFIATKLCRHFVADSPPPALVDRVAAEYLATETEIGPVMRMILTSEEFADTSLEKVRRPFELIAAQSRSVGLDVSSTEPGELRVVSQLLRQMGEPIYTWPSPDGPPDVASPWINAGTMLQRWNLTLSLTAGDLQAASVDIEQHRPVDPANSADFIELMAAGLGVPLDDITRQAGRTVLDSTADPTNPTTDELADLTAVLLVSPAAQRR
ncbi:MAG: DUF1800 domain-containing protein [Actinobacteria bacterium]|nr:MAG: DUF1800 domain-containing protein [Actinomycetota bacterium]